MKTKNPSNKRSLQSEYGARYGITGKFTKQDALKVVEAYGINLHDDFDKLRSDDANTLHDLAILTGYKKPATASGSTARYFYYHLAKIKNPVKNAVQRKLSVAEQHQLKVLKQLIKMDSEMIPFAGGGYNSVSEVANVLHNKFGYSDKQIEKMRGYPLAGRSTTKRNATATDFKQHQSRKLTDLAKMFQGAANGEKRRVLESEYTPNDKYRLGYLVQLKIKDGGRTIPIDFDGESYLAGDLKNNLWIVGKDARISNVKLPPNGQMKYLGELVQVDYVTAKKHIEGGKTVRFYHRLGEVTGEKPNLFIDSDGFPIIIGGAFDVWDVGIVN